MRRFTSGDLASSNRPWYACLARANTKPSGSGESGARLFYERLERHAGLRSGRDETRWWRATGPCSGDLVLLAGDSRRALAGRHATWDDGQRRLLAGARPSGGERATWANPLAGARPGRRTTTTQGGRLTMDD
jgi:hypothetical protein